MATYYKEAAWLRELIAHNLIAQGGPMNREEFLKNCARRAELIGLKLLDKASPEQLEELQRLNKESDQYQEPFDDQTLGRAKRFADTKGKDSEGSK